MLKNYLPRTKASKINGMVNPAISPYEATADFEILRPMIMNSSATHPKKQPQTDKMMASLYCLSASDTNGLNMKPKSRGSVN